VNTDYKILITDPVDDACVDILREEGFSVERKTGLSEEELGALIGGYDVLIVRSGTQVTAGIIGYGAKLKIIGRAGTGVDNIDVDAATRKGIIVMNTPGGNTVSTAEHAISLLMAMARNIPQACAALKNGKWDRKTYRGVEVFGKTIGIIGLGKIGKEVAVRLQGFGMNVLGYDPLVADDVIAKLNIESVTIDELLRRSDYITIHTPLNDETRGLLNEKTLGQCKRGVRIINCARGGIIDEQALLAALNDGQVAGAALDVYEQEPPASDHPLLKHPNVVVTPHLGASTVEAQEKVAVQIAHQIADALKERSLVGAVNISAAQFSVREDHKPYLQLAERIGSIAGQIMEGKLKSIACTVAGEGLHGSFEILKSAVLRGVLSPRLDQPVNDVNAPYFARELGIALSDRKDDSTGNYPQLLTVEYETDKEQRKISGTVFGVNSIRIVQVDDYRVEVEPSGPMLFYWNIDRPGMLAAVGSILADANINIAGLSLGRKAFGEEALTIIDLDSDVPASVIDTIAGIDGVINPKLVKV
jgi:D-3-phosphoglycerate dehydrogenase / 2-oxoglutarate reductase